MIISIHQPNFMPWYPFFQKIQSVDKFVILTRCQFEKNGYQNRFSLNDRWYTMSINKGLKSINEKIYVDPQKDWDRIKGKLKKYKSVLDEFDNCISVSVVKTNINIINKLCNILNIQTEVVLDYPTELKSTERLVDLCKKYGATEYLSGIGGKDYLDASLFDKSGIKTTFQNNMVKKHVLEIL